MPIDMSTVVKRAANQVSCNLDGEVAILNLDSALYFGLDDVGSTIWNALGEGATVGRICEAVRAEFEVGEAECRADVIAFLERLADAGLVEIAGAAEA